MIRALFWQVLQNVFRLGVIVGIPAIFLWQGGFLEEKADRLPWWVIIGIGALIGGFVSTPATNIGNLVWAILGAYLRRTIGRQAPEGRTEEETRVLRELEYRKWVRWQQQSSVFLIAGRITRRVFLPLLAVFAVLFIPIMAVARPVGPIFEVVLIGLVIIVVVAMMFSIGFGFATGIGIKSFHYQE